MFLKFLGGVGLGTRYNLIRFFGGDMYSDLGRRIFLFHLFEICKIVILLLL